MSLDIDIIKARAKNEYRLSKVRGEAMISVRIPGGSRPPTCWRWPSRSPNSTATV